jgi:hypothetical protein
VALQEDTVAICDKALYGMATLQDDMLLEASAVS